MDEARKAPQDAAVATIEEKTEREGIGEECDVREGNGTDRGEGGVAYHLEYRVETKLGRGEDPRPQARWQSGRSVGHSSSPWTGPNLNAYEKLR